MPFRVSRTHVTPFGRPQDQAVGGRLTSMRVSTEPIQNCRVGPFLRYLNALLTLVKVRYPNLPEPKAQNDTFHVTAVVRAIQIVAADPTIKHEAKNLGVEMRDCRTLRQGVFNPHNIFIVEMAFNPPGRRPEGTPISGDYQGSFNHFVETAEQFGC